MGGGGGGGDEAMAKPEPTAMIGGGDLHSRRLPTSAAGGASRVHRKNLEPTHRSNSHPEPVLKSTLLGLWTY